ncbi:siroheme synthase [Vibrio sinensis]|uniref:precorrin-2 dehydrogenase n=1 Tax=Vibrio sinensis TaxID=2302434 RepID=A0A3A6R737_9VIBR|nr:bifunctional precorrin-2 dehydrogenase/sirohydrochlorin ferrochelatase [Vibrio sinensis]RJX72842.1 siroheme synthase [Vibrio sinensis]
MQYFPIFLDLKDKSILVVGGGEVACRKVDGLIRAGADVTIVSPKIASHLVDLVAKEECRWVQNFYSAEMLDRRFVQVWATTDNPSLNHQVYQDAHKLGILVNVVDDLPYCDFITPSMVNRGRIQIAISSGGASPVLVRNIREKLESVLPHNLALVAEFAASKRNDIKSRLPDVDSRRRFWERFFDSAVVELAISRDALELHYAQCFENNNKAQARVTWIEFGDDVELLPIKALRMMQQAELVLFHFQCPFSFVDLVRRDAERSQFHDEADLAALLEQANQNGLRVCIFVPEKSTSYQWLRGDDLHIKLGQV